MDDRWRRLGSSPLQLLTAAMVALFVYGGGMNGVPPTLALDPLNAGLGNVTVGTCLFQYTNNGKTYTFDLNPLILPYGSMYWATDKDKYWYMFNICGEVNCTTGNPDSAICQTSASSYTPHHQLAYYTHSGITAYWDMIDYWNLTRGIKFYFANGDGCGSPSAPRFVTYYFDCDPGANFNVNFTVSGVGSCGYDMHFATNRTCIPGFIPPPLPSSSTGPAGGSSTGGSRGSTGTVLSSTGPYIVVNGTITVEITLSTGSWICVGFGIFMFSYVLFGCIHRRAVYGVVGCDACPNFPFWRALPGLLADGFRFTWHKITCRRGPVHGVKYDNIK